MKKLFCLGLLSFCFLANAGVHGEWKGEGTLLYPDGRIAQCMETTLSFSKRGDRLKFSHDYFICDNVNFVIDAWKNNYILKNKNEIWIGDIVHVGRYENDHVIFAASGEIDEELILEGPELLVYKLYEGHGAILKFHLKRTR